MNEWMAFFPGCPQLSVCGGKGSDGQGVPGTAELLPPAQPCQGDLGVILGLSLGLCVGPELCSSSAHHIPGAPHLPEGTGS